jgi:hypothetical protein
MFSMDELGAKLNWNARSVFMMGEYTAANSLAGLQYGYLLAGRGKIAGGSEACGAGADN